MTDRARVPDFAFARCSSDRPGASDDVARLIRAAEMWLAGVHSDTNEPDLVFADASWPAIWRAIPRSAAVWAAFAAMQVAARHGRALEATATVALPPTPTKAKPRRRFSLGPIEL
jgi:hypothetical protein